MKNNILNEIRATCGKTCARCGFELQPARAGFLVQEETLSLEFAACYLCYALHAAETNELFQQELTRACERINEKVQTAIDGLTEIIPEIADKATLEIFGQVAPKETSEIPEKTSLEWSEILLENEQANKQTS